MRKLILLSLSLLLLTSCGSLSDLTRANSYPEMYNEKPGSILILPPINKTVNVEAKEYFFTSLAKPLCEKGYYVISPFLSMETLKSESAYDSEMFLERNLKQFQTVFGADAVLFTTINRWERSTIGGTIIVNVEYLLKSTTTNKILFDRKGTVTIDMNTESSGGGLLGALVDLAATAIATASTDKVVAARKCNVVSLQDLPEGKYSSTFDKDQNTPAGNKEFKVLVK